MKQIRFGIVGTGSIAHRFARAVKNFKEAKLTAVASRTNDKAEKFGNEYGIPYRFSSYEDMANSDVIDAAYIAVPHSGHAPAAIMMMEKGKNVLCEKPLAMNENEAKSMFKCAEDNNVFLMEAMWSRLLPATAELIKTVKGGAIGEVKGVDAKFCFSKDYDSENRVFNKDCGGGSLLDVGVYALNFAEWFLGKDISEIYAAADIQHGIDTHLCALLKYKSGAIADISSAVMLKKPEYGYIYGTKGYISVNSFYNATGFEVFIDGKEPQIIKMPYIGNGFEEQIVHFCGCIFEGFKSSPIITPDNSIFIAHLMDEIKKIIGLSYKQDAAAKI